MRKPTTRLRLTEMILAASEGKQAQSGELTFGGETVPSRFEVKDGDVKFRMKSPVILKAGQTLDIQVEGE